MVNQFLGEIKLFGGNFAISGWAQCTGQLISIQQNTALFSLLGTMYGGNGTSNFGLPDLQGRAAGQVGPNTYQVQGMKLGAENVSLTQQNYPSHSHTFAANGTPVSGTAPANNFLAGATGTSQIYVTAQGATAQPLNNGATPEIGMAPGGSVAHQNMQPYLAMTYLIAMQGVFPSRN
ncbi:MAG TPA: tail fiber protein [Chloroflexota bacterium]|jgi:microcystin-dependent protein|nr:tail fiber protein [Chloroflexota bacterium]